MHHSQAHITMYYLHVQDFVDAYIGPFPTAEAAEEHYLWTRNVRGDGAVKVDISTNTPPEGEMVMTPEADKAWKSDYTL